MGIEKIIQQTPEVRTGISQAHELKNYQEVVSLIKERISEAEKNPISVDRYADLENQINRINADFIERGFTLSEDTLKEDTILVEFMKSSAMAYNITEFHELLKQVGEKYDLGEKWVTDLLAHENSHANVLEKQNAIWKGYGVIFIKDESGALSSLQPLNFSRSNPDWDPKQMLTNSIESTKAPLEYGGKLSDGDIDAVKLAEKQLKSI